MKLLLQFHSLYTYNKFYILFLIRAHKLFLVLPQGKLKNDLLLASNGNTGACVVATFTVPAGR
jgi:hypothetical protein